MEIVAIVPARFASSRFPGKPLVDLAGKSMIVRVCEQVAQCRKIDRFYVATDDERIEEHCINADLPVVMTSPDHHSGTERVAEVAGNLQADVIINVQGDEPFLDPLHLDALCNLFGDENVKIASLYSAIQLEEEMASRHVVKVVKDLQERALYFSRAAIPADRENQASRADRHVGIYGFRMKTLLSVVQLEATPLEQIERLEQLRWLEHGYRIHLAQVGGTAPAIDTPEDVHRALLWMEQNAKDI
ncbi:MAG: 3-deoxy-manno-octulosonate cytidylyltransferase [Saprospiraceae bacterium]|nr:3-deoxy-manno-octulosonate cytidylyltransferase [Saprospiraceae bacterium]